MITKDVVAGTFQLYVKAPLAVKVAFSPVQTSILFELAVTVGFALTISVKRLEPTQPFVPSP